MARWGGRVSPADLNRQCCSRTEIGDDSARPCPEEFLSEQVQHEIEQKKRDEEWKARHELAMKEFDGKLNDLIAWLDDFVKRNPKNGK